MDEPKMSSQLIEENSVASDYLECSENLENGIHLCDVPYDDCSNDQINYCSKISSSFHEFGFQQLQTNNLKKGLWRIFYKKRSIIIPFFWGILVGVTMTAVLFQQHVLHQSSFLLDSDNAGLMNNEKRNYEQLKTQNFKPDQHAKLLQTTSQSSTITNKVHITYSLLNILLESY